jgi:hypothetical protein
MASLGGNFFFEQGWGLERPRGSCINFSAVGTNYNTDPVFDQGWNFFFEQGWGLERPRGSCINFSAVGTNYNTDLEKLQD